jgi:hypothetical protein
MTEPQKARRQYMAGNQPAAQIILAHVAKYGGEQAGLVIWARAVMS